MTLTKRDLKAAIKAFKETNKKENRRQELYIGQRSSLYQLIVDDIKKGKVSSNRKNRKSLNELPKYVAPLEFTEENKVPFLWSCKMHTISSSFINAVGYNEKHRVLKIILNNTYTYAYQDVPFSAFNTFISSKSAGKYFNRFIKNYSGIRLS